MFSISKLLTSVSARKTRRSDDRQEQASRAAEGPESRDFYPSRTQVSASASVTNRDLCIVILRDTLRMYGIPLEWINIEVFNVSRNAASVHLQINFVIQYWHEGLLMYAPALQQEFLQSLQNFDSDHDHSRHSVCWKFSARCRSPFTEIPGPSFWATQINQFEDVMSEPVTLPPAVQYQAPMKPVQSQLTMDILENTRTPFRFDLPPLDRERAHFGDFPSTIPLSIEKMQ
jgi:hypothetical protein